METAIPQAIGVATGISEVGLLVTVAGFYLVITAIMMIVFIRWFVRLVNKIFDTQQVTLENILQAQKMQDSKISQLKEALTGEILNQVRAFSNYAFDYNMHQVSVSIGQIKDDNNLENRDAVEKKVRAILGNLYNRRNSNFDFFTYNGRKLSYYTNPEWEDIVFKYCVDAIYDGEPYHRTRHLDGLDIIYERIKIEFFNNLKAKV